MGALRAPEFVARVRALGCRWVLAMSVSNRRIASHAKHFIALCFASSPCGVCIVARCLFLPGEAIFFLAGSWKNYGVEETAARLIR